MIFKLDFYQFPVINPDVPLAEEAPTDTIHIPSNAKNKEDAKKFLAYLARAEVQTEINKTLGQLPINKDSQVGDDKFLQAGYAMLSSTDGGIAQFFDRDYPAEMAKAVSIPIIASGGIKDTSDIKALCQADAPIYAAITGRAIYEGSLDFASAQTLADQLSGAGH